MRFELPLTSVAEKMLYIQVDPEGEVQALTGSSETAMWISREVTSRTCHSGSYTLSDETYEGATVEQAEHTLSTSGDIHVASGSTVIYEAGTEIKLKPNFRVHGNGSFKARIAPVECAE